MRSLITLNDKPDQPRWLGDGDGNIDIRLDDNAKEYSRRLKSLAQKCTAFDPTDRPTFKDILEQIQRAVNEGLANETDEDDDELIRTTDTYSPGMALADLPPRP